MRPTSMARATAPQSATRLIPITGAMLPGRRSYLGRRNTITSFLALQQGQASEWRLNPGAEAHMAIRVCIHQLASLNIIEMACNAIGKGTIPNVIGTTGVYEPMSLHLDRTGCERNIYPVGGSGGVVGKGKFLSETQVDCACRF